MKRLLSLLMCTLLALSALTPALAQGDAVPTGYVALTFDDGPSPDVSQTLLQVLAGRNVNATFFLCGYRMDECPGALEACLAGGHEVGVHGYSHTYMQKLTPQEDRCELEQTLRLLEAAGVNATLFRPPGGLSSDDLLGVSEELGLALIGWSVDPRDWECQCASVVARRVLSCAKDGDIILMHELFPSSAQAAGLIIDGLRAKGLEPVTVSQLAQLRGVTLQPGLEYRRLP